MCGRFTQMRTWSELLAIYRITDPGPPIDVRPRYNAAPTQLLPVVRTVAGGRGIALMRWGLIPSWAKDPAIGARLINARSETLADKPAFRAAFRRRRCLVAADGFYEWQPQPRGPKQPFHIAVGDRRPLAFAGLWECWRPPDGDPLETFTIATTAANAACAPIHDRMPVILEEAEFEAWLDSDRPLDAVAALLKPYAGVMTVVPVSRRVNTVGTDDPSLIDRSVSAP